MNSTTQIMDIAERRMRERGYNAVSFRDIASEMGIKSASLHYHFPKKADLGAALVRRYSETLRATLSHRTRGMTDPAERLSAYINIYRTALTEQKLVCLCAVLGAEAPGLPDNVAREVRIFFEENISWLTGIYSELGGKNPQAQAKSTLAALEGAMIVASVNKDMEVFEAVAARVLPHWVKQPLIPNQD